MESEVSSGNRALGYSSCKSGDDFPSPFSVVIPGFLVMFSNLCLSAPLASPLGAYGIYYVPGSKGGSVVQIVIALY